jgi:hypothetical protein
MKIIDLANLPSETETNSALLWLKNLLPGSKAHLSEREAQDQVILRLERALGDDFILIREVRLPGLGTTIPMVLVGPPGIFVMYASAVKGTYRARGEAWLKLDNSGDMRNSSPNLPHRTRLYAEAIRKFLTQNNLPNTDIEAVLLFSEPEAFVENIKAPIRMVMCDGLESYSGSLRLLNPIFSPEEQTAIERLLSNPEGKPTVADEIAAAEEEITAQPVIMPSDQPQPDESRPVAPQVEEQPDFITEEVMRGAFIEDHPEPQPIPIPPVIEVAVDQAPTGAAYAVTSLLERTRMNSTQITLLGLFVLLDLMAICGLLAFVLFALPR